VLESFFLCQAFLSALLTLTECLLLHPAQQTFVDKGFKFAWFLDLMTDGLRRILEVAGEEISCSS
jgi:hypothetical protein